MTKFLCRYIARNMILNAKNETKIWCDYKNEK